jgi:hypothetical protein
MRTDTGTTTPGEGKATEFNPPVGMIRITKIYYDPIAGEVKYSTD